MLFAVDEARLHVWELFLSLGSRLPCRFLELGCEVGALCVLVEH